MLSLCGLTGISQPLTELFNAPRNTDTLYFPYKNGIQLIIVDACDAWNNQVAMIDAAYPRGGSAADYMGPQPKNLYIFRNETGDIIKVYNLFSDTIKLSLKESGFVSASFSDLNTIMDYRELNHHLKFYGDSGKVGLINLQGKIVLPAEYHEIRKFQDNRERHDKLMVNQNGLFGLLDSNMNFLFEPQYKAPNYYPEHDAIGLTYIRVSKGGKQGLINENGDVLIDFKYDHIRLIHDTLYTGYILKENHEKISGRDFGEKVTTCVVFDKHFTPITRLENYNYIKYWGIKNFIVKKEHKFGVVDHLGKTIIPMEYTYLSSYQGHYFVSKDGKSGLFSYEGELVLPIEFQSIFIRKPAIYVKRDGLIGVYHSKNYKCIAEPQFIRRYWDMGKFMLVREDESTGFVQYKHTGHKLTEVYYQSPEGKITKFAK